MSLSLSTTNIHKINVTKPYCFDSVSVIDATKVSNLYLPMMIKNGLNVTSGFNPTPNLFINDNDYGRLQPGLEIPLAPGNYNIKFRVSGYVDKELSIQILDKGIINIVDDKTTNYNSDILGITNIFITKMQASTGVYATSNPPGAEIFINGVDTYQITPSIIPKPVGTYSVQFVFKKLISRVVVENGKITNINADLTKNS